MRANGVLRQYFYHELKGGLSYDLDKNFTVLGGRRYATSDYQNCETGPLNVEKRLKLEHRYRVEQR